MDVPIDSHCRNFQADKKIMQWSCLFPVKWKKVLHRSTMEPLILLIVMLVVMCAITLRLFVGPQLDSCTLILTLRLRLLSMNLKELCLSAVSHFLTTVTAVFSQSIWVRKTYFIMNWGNTMSRGLSGCCFKPLAGFSVQCFPLRCFRFSQNNPAFFCLKLSTSTSPLRGESFFPVPCVVPCLSSPLLGKKFFFHTTGTQWWEPRCRWSRILLSY